MCSHGSQPTDAHVPLLLQFQLYVELLEGYKLILHLAKKISSPGTLYELGFRVWVVRFRVWGLGAGLEVAQQLDFSLLLFPSDSGVLGEVPLVRTTLNAWRDRLPNDCDAISCWNDLFVWWVHSKVASFFLRLHVFVYMHADEDMNVGSVHVHARI